MLSAGSVARTWCGIWTHISGREWRPSGTGTEPLVSVAPTRYAQSMSDSPPFRADKAKDAIEGDGDFLLPMCLPDPEAMMGEDIAVIVLTTAEDQRVGIPLGIQGLSDLHELIGEVLRRMQGDEGNIVQ